MMTACHSALKTPITVSVSLYSAEYLIKGENWCERSNSNHNNFPSSFLFPLSLTFKRAVFLFQFQRARSLIPLEGKQVQHSIIEILSFRASFIYLNLCSCFSAIEKEKFSTSGSIRPSFVLRLVGV